MNCTFKWDELYIMFRHYHWPVRKYSDLRHNKILTNIITFMLVRKSAIELCEKLQQQCLGDFRK